MNIDTFETFLKSQKDGFAAFLKGCKDLDREQMRIALATHSSKMTFTLTTEFPIIGIGPSIGSPYKSPTPHCSIKRTSSSSFKSLAATTTLRSHSPPGSNRHFKSPGSAPEIPPLPSIFKRKTSFTAATPANTPTSKKSADSDSSKPSPYARIRSTNRSGMTIGGAGRLFSSVTVTPKGKGYADDDSESSAGSPLTDDSYPNRPYSKRSVSAKKNKTPTSPFEIAAKKAERKRTYFDSESTSDFEISIGKPKSTVRKVSSAKSEKEKVPPMKCSGDMMDVEGTCAAYETDGDMWEGKKETPTKKQNTVSSGGVTPKAALEFN
jgi:hypothetical protein